MKKIALTVLCTALITATMFSQDTTAVTRAQPVTPATPAVSDNSPKFRMGLSGSTVLSWFSLGNQVPEAQGTGDGTRFNIQYGLHMDFRLGSNENYYFSTGLFVLNTGGTVFHQNVFEGDQAAALTYEHRINYLNIPITMMLRTKEIGYVTYFARVGVDAGFNISSTYDETVDISGQPTVTTEDAGDNYAALFRAALHIEGGFEYNISGSTRLFASLEWNNGLTNVFTNDYEVNISAPDSQGEAQKRRIKGNNNALMLNVGVYF